jgi:hypothetical protein
MSLETNETFEDRVLDELLERLNDNVAPAVGAGSDPSRTSTDKLVREYLELLGLLPYELETVQPSPVVKQRIMSAVEGTASYVEEGTAGAAEIPMSANVAEMPTRRRTNWALPLAAGLAVALFGLSIWQSGHLREQRGVIDELAVRLDEANQEIAGAAEYRDGLRKAETNLALVSSPGVEICTLRPGDTETVQEQARGTLFVAADHKSWYMRLEGLVPCPLGRKHQIWFVKRDGTAVSGGLFDVSPGEGIEVTSDLMPSDTVAVMITLEPEGGSVEPTGPSVLYGDEVMRIL